MAQAVQVEQAQEAEPLMDIHMAVAVEQVAILVLAVMAVILTLLVVPQARAVQLGEGAAVLLLALVAA
jgi:hypothetical protein